jgi:hypothetical protein
MRLYLDRLQKAAGCGAESNAILFKSQKTGVLDAHSNSGQANPDLSSLREW